MLERFADAEGGGFFSTAVDDEPLVARRKDLEDAPIPAGGSSAAFGLLRLAALTGEAALRGGAPSASCGCCTRSRRSTRPASGTCCRRSTSTSRRCARSRWSARTAAPLEAVVRAHFRPHLVLAGGGAGERAAAGGPHAGRGPRRRLRVRALRLPAAGDRAGGARRAAGSRRMSWRQTVLARLGAVGAPRRRARAAPRPVRVLRARSSAATGATTTSSRCCSPTVLREDSNCIDAGANVGDVLRADRALSRRGAATSRSSRSRIWPPTCAAAFPPSTCVRPRCRTASGTATFHRVRDGERAQQPPPHRRGGGPAVGQRRSASTTRWTPATRRTEALLAAEHRGWRGSAPAPTA